MPSSARSTCRDGGAQVGRPLEAWTSRLSLRERHSQRAHPPPVPTRQDRESFDRRDPDRCPPRTCARRSARSPTSPSRASSSTTSRRCSRTPRRTGSIDLMLEPYRGEQIDIVVGMESRGFIFSAPMAYQLGAGLVPVRKLGKLPAETIIGRVRPRVRLEHARDPPRRDPARPEGPDRRRPARDRRDGPGHDRARRAAQGRGRRPRVPRRARLPQGPRPARGPPRHERHPVLTRPIASDRIEPDDRPDRTTDRQPAADVPPTRGRRGLDGATGDARRPATGPTSPGGGSSASSPASSSRRRRPSSAPRALQRPSAEAAGAILDPSRRRRSAAPPRRPRPATPTGAERVPHRRSGRGDERPVLIDQRKLPDALVEYAARTAAEVAVRDPRHGRPRRAGDRPGRRDRPRADGATRSRDREPHARRATIRGGGNALRAAPADRRQPGLGGRPDDGPL